MLLKESKPLISVVVPVYNVEKYLRCCIDSILNQDCDNYEVILVDDGSSDKSGEICDQYADRNENITVIHKENGGLSSARLSGFRVAKGELICFIDSDDYIAPTYLSRMSNSFSDANVDLSICAYAHDREGEITNSSLPYSRKDIVNERISEDYTLAFIAALNSGQYKDIPGFVPIRMFRKKLLRESDFLSEREYFTEDILLNILYANRLNGKIAVINEPLYFYCINIGSLTQSFRKNAFKMLLACNQMCKELTKTLEVDEIHRQARLDANLCAAVTYGIYNIGKIPVYSDFKKSLLEIFKNPEVVSLFKRNAWRKEATWHKIIYYSYQLKLYFLLFKLLKTRKTL